MRVILVSLILTASVRLEERDGQLHFPSSLMQLEAEAEMKNAPLYVVNVNLDYKKLDPAEGVTVVFDANAYSLRLDRGLKASNALAWGHMEESLGKTGWDELYAETSPTSRATNDVKMYAVGFLEGLMTAVRLSQFYSNFYQLILMNEDNEKAMVNVKTMYKEEVEFVKKNANLHPGVLSVEPVDPYWKHIRYNLFQLWGLKDGYNYAALAHGVRMVDLVDMFMINSHGELTETLQAYVPEQVEARRKAQRPGGAASLIQSFIAKARSPDFLAKGMDPDTDWEMRMRKSRCSAFVRLTEQNQDLLVGHTTWDDYSKMTRIFKYYKFSLPGAWTKATHIGFSSYPGCISSTDSFYIMNSGLAVVDTQLEILNPRVYDRVPEFPSNPKLPQFIHIMAVNRMAGTAVHWTTLFAERNSGTGNAQWMIIDYNRFSPGSPLPDNTVWLLEMIPQVTDKMDLSGHLRSSGYWGSYNRPYFDNIRSMTGHQEAEARHGGLYSFSGNPRAQIFSRVGVSVENLFDMRNLMTRNAFPNEGTLPNAAGHAVSARMDLVGYSPIPNGGIDAKVINRCLFKQLQVQAISGPTHQMQKVFAWKDKDGKDLWPGWPHLGLPDVWDFDWIQMSPTKATSRVYDVQC